ncbi:hypothetical protein B0H17DRAFT_1125043 [Mycena rosella]|uniref:Uncharacterized protein n=1 Tax=Mycena rosella TaxID=1033263 RepID=A0AAD7MAN4_MYCRO|nr:hypothetical protein B0H17DRAFT_1125043 [Mycena rosella]
MFLRLSSLLTLSLVACKVVADTAQYLDDQDLDPTCPEGYYPGVTVDEAMYTVPIDVLHGVIGSFFHAQWYTITNTTNVGKDNTVGSTREGHDVDGNYFKERLVRVFQTPSEKMIAWKSQVNNSVRNPSGNETAVQTTYTEEHRLMSICGGTATLVNMWNVQCANDLVNDWDEWYRMRGQALDAVITKLGAKQFKGTCPAPLPKRKSNSK